MNSNHVQIFDITPKKNENIVRLAIEPPAHISASSKLHIWDVTQSLEEIIDDIAEHYEISCPRDYSIRFTDRLDNVYITEQTKGDVKDGIILKLTTAPWKVAKEICTALKSGSASLAGHKVEALETLAVSAKDITFGAEFVKLQGVDVLIKKIESGKEKQHDLWCILAGLLALMTNKQVPSDLITSLSLKKIASFVSQSTSDNADVVKTSLAILESVVLNCPEHYVTVSNEVTISYLQQHLDNRNLYIQKNCLALINALCLKATKEKKQRFEENIASRELRTVLHEKVVRAAVIPPEMMHHLYVFQQLCFNLLHTRRMTNIDQNNENHQEMILGLRSTAFEADPESQKKVMFDDDFKKLGFSYPTDPVKDFEEAVPPGLLALQSWSYFANQQTDSYAQIVNENLTRSEDYQCPFAKACIELTECLCKILCVGSKPNDTSQKFHPIFFTSDRSFEELFCHSVKLFHKTWKEMRATNADFTKVMSVVEEQIKGALGMAPPSLDMFSQRLQNDFAYIHIKELRQQERISQDERNDQTQSVIDLKEQVKVEVEELIKQQRLNYMVNGSKFGRSRKDLKTGRCSLFLRLSSNHKVLHYGDYRDSSSLPPADSLKNKISVVDMVAVNVTKNLTTGKSKNDGIQFSIDVQGKSRLDLVADSQELFERWLDGLNILLGKKATSLQAKIELENLLSIEMHIRLLDTGNIILPQNPLPIPPPPVDFNFSCE